MDITKASPIYTRPPTPTPSRSARAEGAATCPRRVLPRGGGRRRRAVRVAGAPHPARPDQRRRRHHRLRRSITPGLGPAGCERRRGARPYGRPGSHAARCYRSDGRGGGPAGWSRRPRRQVLLRRPRRPRRFHGRRHAGAAPEQRDASRPQKASETWIQTDPEHLIKLVGDRQTAWDLFVPMVRVLKLSEGRPGHQPQVADRRGHGPQPHARRLPAPQVLYRFFNAMEGKIGVAVMDPAGLCGPTQREIDWTKAGDAIRAPPARRGRPSPLRPTATPSAPPACGGRSSGRRSPSRPGGQPSNSSGAAALGVGLMVGVGAGKPRPVKDAPQG